MASDRISAQAHLDGLDARLAEPTYISADWLWSWRAIARELLLDMVGRALTGTRAATRAALAKALDQDAARQVSTHNQGYLAEQLATHDDWFDQVEAYPLTPRQRSVIAREESNLLVLAGAGAGKTSTVVGRVGYLLHTGKAAPEEILLLAYNRSAARELEERIAHRLGARVAAWTFHGLGRQIITQVEGRGPTLDGVAGNPRALAEELQGIVRTLFDEHYRDVARFFLFYHRPYRPPHRFADRTAYARYLRAYDVRTFQDETVHSAEACIVANWLYCNGIDYVYRPRGHGPHRPDFWLPQHELIIDIAVLDQDGQPPAFVEADAYLARLSQARQAHNDHRIEVRSADLMDNRLARRLRRQLAAHGVPMTPLSSSALLETLERRRDIDQLVTLLATFLHHAKSGRLDHAALLEAARAAPDAHRAQAFVELLREVRRRYEAGLRDRNAIDFDDMIARAGDYVEAGKHRTPHRFVIVDEFQDISRGRLRLLKALLAQSDERQLMCVGDDWQSIYRFAGSDLHLLRGLSTHVGPVRMAALDRTFRFHDGLAELSAHFVCQNPAQLPKTVQARAAPPGPAAVVLFEQDCPEGALSVALTRVAEETGEDGASVLLLGRYRFLEPDMDAEAQRYPSLRLRFLTVHASKGLEADYVVILGMVAGRLGFPTEVSDDPLLDMVLSAPEHCENAEERRLFYVALTRARQRAFLLTDRRRPSGFVEELTRSAYADWVQIGG